VRAQDEILARIRAAERVDVFGFAWDILFAALDYDHAKPFLMDGTTKEQWPGIAGDIAVKKDALAYLEFAWGKAEEHRGISADRSVTKLTEYCWLLGLDVARIEAAPYPQYGCPKLKVVSELLGAVLPTSPELLRMMNGDCCVPACDSGCGK
jgi:hypothetical protein